MKRYYLRIAVPVFILAFIYTGCTQEGLKYVYKAPAVIPYAFYDYANNTPVTINGSVNLKNLSFEIYFQFQQIKTASLVLPGNQAYALSLAEPIPVPLEKISAINIRPLTNYSSNYPALANITEKCTFHFSHAANDTITLANLINDINNVNNRPYSSTYFRLTESPTDVQTPHRFIVEIITDNNVRLADTTHAIFITQ